MLHRNYGISVRMVPPIAIALFGERLSEGYVDPSNAPRPVYNACDFESFWDIRIYLSGITSLIRLIAYKSIEHEKRASN
jgi:hypothetical protein